MQGVGPEALEAVLVACHCFINDSALNKSVSGSSKLSSISADHVMVKNFVVYPRPVVWKRTYQAIHSHFSISYRHAAMDSVMQCNVQCSDDRFIFMRLRGAVLPPGFPTHSERGPLK